MSGSFNVVSGSGGNLPRSFAGIDRKINSARWLDNDEKLGFCQDVSSELFTLNATAYHYGTDLVVRVAELS
jgi:hypothetical protein